MAIGLGYLLGYDLFALVYWSGTDFLWGCLATVPLLLGLVLLAGLPWRPLRRIREATDELLLPLFRESTLLQLVALCVAAGFGEELLFRGVIQSWATDLAPDYWQPWFGPVAASLLFGLAHWVTHLYAALAMLISLYFAWLWAWSGNLLVPITAHGMYDFFAILYFLHLGRKSQAEAGVDSSEPSSSPESSPPDDVMAERILREAPSGPDRAGPIRPRP